jgi:tetratricopeptide (TPR) repeat protein
MKFRLSASQLLGAITVFSALVVAAPASAQSKKKPAAEQNEGDAEARRLFKEGDKLYAEGDYEGAVRAFEKSYELSRQPALKYNLANAYERLARYEEALNALKEYEPHAAADERDVVKRRVGKLQERAEQQRLDKEKGIASSTPSESSTEASPPASEPDAPAGGASVSSDTPVLGYVLVGVGAVGVGLGAYFGIQALGTQSDAEAACKESGGARRCPSSASGTLDSNQRSAIIADVGIGVGIVAAAVGTFLIFKSKSKDTAATELRAAAGPQGGGLNLVGRF